jgi:hypothetical protein
VVSRVLFRAGRGGNRLTISDHPTAEASVVIEVVAGGQAARLTLGRAEVGTGMLAAITGKPTPVPAGLGDEADDVTEHVHDWLGGRPVCQIGNCDEPVPAGPERDYAGVHACDFDAAGRCRYCNVEARRG